MNKQKLSSPKILYFVMKKEIDDTTYDEIYKKVFKEKQIIIIDMERMDFYPKKQKRLI